MRPELLDAAVELMGRAGRGGAVRVRGESMEPTLSAGDVLAVEFATGRLRFGDLILFRQAGSLVVHRFLGPARAPDGTRCLRTRGDAVLALDPALSPDRLVGRVVAIHRKGEWRSLREPGARRYARAVAAHDLFWAAVAVFAGRFDRLARLRGTRLALRPRAGSVDRRALRLADALLFDRIHPPVPAPPEADGTAGGAASAPGAAPASR